MTDTDTRTLLERACAKAVDIMLSGDVATVRQGTGHHVVTIRTVESEEREARTIQRRVEHAERTKQDTERELSRVVDELADVRETGAAELARASDDLVGAAVEIERQRQRWEKAEALLERHTCAAEVHIRDQLERDLAEALEQIDLLKTEGACMTTDTATIDCPVKCEGCDVVVPMAGAMHTEDPVYLCGKCAAGAVESQMRAERDAAIAARDEALRDRDHYRAKAAVDSTGEMGSQLVETAAWGRTEKARADAAEQMVAELRDKWKGVKRAYFGSSDPLVAINAFDAALASTAEVAGRWQRVPIVDSIVQHARDIAAERDAAIAARDEALRDFDACNRSRMEFLAEKHAAERARDEVGLQLAAAQAEIARLMKGVRDVERFMMAEWRPPAEAVLAMVRDVAAGGPYVPGDALAPRITAALEASGIDASNVKGVE